MLLPYQNHQPQLMAGAWVADSAQVIGKVSVGADSSVFFQSVLRADINRIAIGDRTNIQDHCTVHVSGKLPALVGSDVSVGHRCILHACRIGDRVLVGMGAILMDGVRVEADSIVASGSLLPGGKQYPPGSLILGSPASVVRGLEESERDSLLELAARYVRVKDSYLRQR